MRFGSWIAWPADATMQSNRNAQDTAGKAVIEFLKKTLQS